MKPMMNKGNLFDYDDRSIDSIFEYAKRLEGMTFNEISDEYNHSLKKVYTNPMEPQSFKVKEDTVEYKTPGENAKGQLSIPLSEVHVIRYRSPHNPLKKSIFFKS